MDSKRSSRRRFLKQAALAGVATGAGLGLRGQSAHAQHHHGKAPRKGARYSIDHMTHYTPLQDYAGIVTPVAAPLHATALVGVSRNRCAAASRHDPRPGGASVEFHRGRPEAAAFRIPDAFPGMPWKQLSRDPWCSRSEHGVAGPVQPRHDELQRMERSAAFRVVERGWCAKRRRPGWLSEGGDAGKFSHTLPLAKAMEDVIVAYGQNGEPLRIEQGYPIRLVVPGWEAPFSVKYLTHIKVVDKPYVAWNEGMNHSVSRPDLGGKARWYHFQFGPKSVITRPSAGIEMVTGICPDYRLGLVRCGRGPQGRSVHRRRPDLEGSEASWAGASEGAYPVYVRLGVGRTGSRDPVSLHGRNG